MALPGKTEIKVTASDALEFEPVTSVPEKSGWGMKVFLIGLLISGAGGGVVLYGDKLSQIWETSETGIPLIKSDKGPVKVRPDNPGGLRVPDRDKLVYGRIQDGKTSEGSARGPERLLPPPEQPLPKPAKAPKPPTLEEPVEQNVEKAGPAKLAESKKPAFKEPEIAKPVAKVPTIKDVVTAKRPAPPPPPPAPTATSSAASPLVSKDKTQQKPVAATPPAKPAPQKTANVVPSAAPSTVEPTAKPAAISRSNSYLIQLAAARSPQGARSEWARLRGKHLDLLGNLGLTVTKADLGPARGVFYRLRAGPIAEEGVARKLCRQLAERQIGCLVIKPEKK